jgi:hypothetical protein
MAKEGKIKEVEQIIRRCVLEKETLSATFSYDALELADTVVVDVQCDYVKDKLGDMRVGRADIAAHHHGHVSAAYVLGADQDYVCGLYHSIGRFNGADQAVRLHHSESNQRAI